VIVTTKFRLPAAVCRERAKKRTWTVIDSDTQFSSRPPGLRLGGGRRRVARG
jgi:hypothetical protein